jgi:ribosomal protein S18 acetylase RimI-like enzyme
MEATARAMDPKTSNGMVLRTGTDRDAAAAADLHAGNINEGFLSYLGPRFLRRLYRRVTRSPESFLLVVDDDGTTVGFLAGSTDVAALYRAFVLRDGVVVSLVSAGRLLRAWRRVIETFRYGSGGGHGAESLSMAVDPRMRGRGAGMLLVEGFLAEIERRGQDAAHVVIGANNEASRALYGRAGFHTVKRFEVHPGTESVLMQWPTRSDADGS